MSTDKEAKENRWVDSGSYTGDCGYCQEKDCSTSHGMLRADACVAKPV